MPEQEPDEVKVQPSTVRVRVERDRTERRERQNRSVPAPAHRRPESVKPIQPVAVTAVPTQAVPTTPTITPPSAVPAEPAPAEPAGPFMVPVDQVAPNPFNTRDVDARPGKVQSLARSIKAIGQLQASPVVDREAFLKIFPPDLYPKEAKVIGNARLVQVNGARRRAAVLLAGRELEVSRKNDLAESRGIWLEATFAENIDREELDPIEQARAIELLVAEAGGNKTAVARRRGRSDTWVKQQLDLLRLEPEVQAALRVDDPDPLDDSPAARKQQPRLLARAVRNWHNDPRDAQLANLARWRRRNDPTFVDAFDSESGTSSEPEPEPKVNRIRKMILRLGGTEAERAQAVRAELSDQERQIWIEELQRD